MNINFNKALMYLNKGNYEKGEENIKKAISECETNKNIYEVIEIYCCYGELLHDLDRDEEAEIYLNKVVQYYNDTYEHETEYYLAEEILSDIEEKRFIKSAFKKLIDRGIASEDMFTESTVTDEDLDKFEETFEIELPSIIRNYFKTYCYDFNYINGHVIEQYSDDIAPLWLDMISVPKDNPLRDLYERMEGFREVTTDEGLINLKKNQIKHLLPIGDWGAGWGPLCIDLTIDDSESKLRWFDHEYFDWEEEGYLDDDNIARGMEALSDFKELLEIYFCGKYDKDYEKQLIEDGEDMPDYSEYIRK